MGYVKFTIWLCVFILTTIFFYWFFSNRLPVVYAQNGQLRLSDFAYHLTLVEAFWKNSAASIYRPETQLSVFRTLYKNFGESIMPLGVSPFSLLLWAPFVILARFSFVLACAAWSALSFCLLVPICLNSVLERTRAARWELIFPSFFIFASWSGLTGLLLGQTSLLACVALVYLIISLHVDAPKSDALTSVRAALAICCLALKPTYALLGAGLLFARAPLNVILLSGGFVTSGTLLVWLRYGNTLFADYLLSLRAYASGIMPAYYAGSISIARMNNASRAFEAILGTANSIFTSSLIYLLGSIFGVLWIGFRRFQRHGTDRPLLVLFALYLLFCPSLGSYEEILFYPFILLASPAREREIKQTRIVRIFLISCACLVANNEILFGSLLTPFARWSVKAFLAGLLLIDSHDGVAAEDPFATSSH